VANSAATLRAPASHHDAVRCGIALYGVSPFEGDPAADGLRPALRLTSRVAQLKTLQVGESSGYGRRLIAAEETRIALVPVGYGDGYPRVLSGRSDVLIRGVRRRVAATISMDALSCVVSDDVEIGDEVVLLGDQGAERVGAEELARLAGTIGYEIVCGLRQRANRSTRDVRPA
jgi:alanine racemase